MRVSSSPIPICKSGPGPAWVKRLTTQLTRGLPDDIVNDINRIIGGVSSSALAQALGARDMDASLDASSVDSVSRSISARIGPATQSALIEGGKLGARDARSAAVLDIGSVNVRRWFDGHAAELVRDLDKTNRDALKAMISRGWSEGKLPAQIAEDVKGVIGLNEVQSKAVIRRRDQLIANEVSPQDVERRVGRYRDRLLAQRADLIARNEVMTGLNQGRQQLWEQLQGAGSMPATQEKEWLTSDDERVCPICGPADGQKQPVGKPFNLENGERMAPPAHPRCRCTVVLVDEE